MTGRSRVARMVRVGTSSALTSHMAMWPSRDADGLIITKEPAPCVAAGIVENEDSPYQVEARSCLLSANGVYKPLPKPDRRTQTQDDRSLMCRHPLWRFVTLLQICRGTFPNFKLLSR